MTESQEDNPEGNEDGYESPGKERPRKKFFSVSKLGWCSQDLTNIMHSPDRERARRRSAKSATMVVERRFTGLLSERHFSDDANEFVLA